MTAEDQPLVHTPHAKLAAGRAAGKLSSALYSKEMDFNQAALSARLEWGLDSDDAEWVIERLRETLKDIQEDKGMSIPELIASGSPDTDSPLLQALNTAEAEIITLREQRDTLLKACKAALNCTGMTWYENGGTIGGKELNDQLRAAILEVEGEK